MNIEEMNIVLYVSKQGVESVFLRYQGCGYRTYQ